MKYLKNFIKTLAPRKIRNLRLESVGLPGEIQIFCVCGGVGLARAAQSLLVAC